jgi:hypothetical protein
VTVVESPGTIGVARQHRVRLTDAELAIICAALRASVAMRKGNDQRVTWDLIQRLKECSPGNPKLRFS